MSKRISCEEIYGDGTQAPDDALLVIDFGKEQYAFRAKEIYDLRINPDSDLQGIQQITEAYKIVKFFKSGGALADPLNVDEDKSATLAARVLQTNIKQPKGHASVLFKKTASGDKQVISDGARKQV